MGMDNSRFLSRVNRFSHFPVFSSLQDYFRAGSKTKCFGFGGGDNFSLCKNWKYEESFFRPHKSIFSTTLGYTNEIGKYVGLQSYKMPLAPEGETPKTVAGPRLGNETIFTVIFAINLALLVGLFVYNTYYIWRRRDMFPIKGRLAWASIAHLFASFNAGTFACIWIWAPNISCTAQHLLAQHSVAVLSGPALVRSYYFIYVDNLQRALIKQRESTQNTGIRTVSLWERYRWMIRPRWLAILMVMVYFNVFGLELLLWFTIYPNSAKDLDMRADFQYCPVLTDWVTTIMISVAALIVAVMGWLMRDMVEGMGLRMELAWASLPCFVVIGINLLFGQTMAWEAFTWEFYFMSIQYTVGYRVVRMSFDHEENMKNPPLSEEEFAQAVQGLTFRDLMGIPSFETCFQAFLVKEYAVENLLFLRAVRELVQKEQDGVVQAEDLTKLYDTFCAEEASLQVNISSRQLKQTKEDLAAVVLHALETGECEPDVVLHVFGPAQEEITKLLESDNFQRFKQKGLDEYVAANKSDLKALLGSVGRSIRGLNTEFDAPSTSRSAIQSAIPDIPEPSFNASPTTDTAPTSPVGLGVPVGLELPLPPSTTASRDQSATPSPQDSSKRALELPEPSIPRDHSAFSYDQLQPH
eukprot:g76498.t1